MSRATTSRPAVTLTPARRTRVAQAAGKDPALVAPLGDGGLLLHVLSFPSRARTLLDIALLDGGGGADARVVEVDGVPPGTATPLTTDARGCPLLVYEDGTVLTLAAG